MSCMDDAGTQFRLRFNMRRYRRNDGDHKLVLFHRPSIYSFHQGLGDGESIVANGVLYASVAFTHGIGHNALAILETDDISSGCHREYRQAEECELEAQA